MHIRPLLPQYASVQFWKWTSQLPEKTSNMGNIKEVIILVFFISTSDPAHGDGDNSGLEAKVNILAERILQLEKRLNQKDLRLENRITNLETGRDSSTSQMFDCYLDDHWGDTEDEQEVPIRFSGCEGKFLTR